MTGDHQVFVNETDTVSAQELVDHRLGDKPFSHPFALAFGEECLDRAMAIGASRCASAPFHVDPHGLLGYDNPREFRTYDILNVGSVHRFMVSGRVSTGRLGEFVGDTFMVHNCGYQGGPGAVSRMRCHFEG